MRQGTLTAILATTIISANAAFAIEPKQVMIEARFVETSNDFSRDLGINWGLYGTQSRREDLSVLIPGLSASGFVGVEYSDQFADDLYFGGVANITQGFSMGNGVAAVGVGMQGDYSSGSSSNLEAFPFLAYEWDNSRISFGEVQNSFDLVVRGFEETGSFSDTLGSPRVLGLRFDTMIGNTFLSASVDEQEYVDIGVALRVTPTIVGYGALELNLDTDSTASAIGLATSVGPLGIRAQINDNGFSNSEFETQVSMNLSDRLRATGYGYLDLGGGPNCGFGLSLTQRIGRSSDSPAFLYGGMRNSGGSTELNVGLSFLFGTQKPKTTETLVFITPRIMREE